MLSHLAVIQRVVDSPQCLETIGVMCKMAAETISSGNKILLCGNGGSAADAQHIAAELVGRFKKERPSMGAMALTVDTSVLTALGNDYGFESIFSRQVEGLGRKGDLLIGISTSGNSPNVLKAMRKAREIGMKTAGLTGSNENAELGSVSDVLVAVPTKDTPRVQEAHILIGHVMCDYVETNVKR